MAEQPLTMSELLARRRRVARIARSFGFVGRIEYRHVRTRTGGAQYLRASAAKQDLLIVSAEAFERDADPDDFNLEAIIAHERGHQLMARNERLLRNIPPAWSGNSEEIVASLLGSLLVVVEKDQKDLLLKAQYDASPGDLTPDQAMLLIIELRKLLERLL